MELKNGIMFLSCQPKLTARVIYYNIHRPNLTAGVSYSSFAYFMDIRDNSCLVWDQKGWSFSTFVLQDLYKNILEERLY